MARCREREGTQEWIGGLYERVFDGSLKLAPIPNTPYNIPNMQLRIATINLMAPAGPFLPWGDRANGLARALAGHQPDLIGTQDATPESLEDLSRGLPGYGVLGRGRWADGGGIQCAIFYRDDKLNLKKSGHFWMSETPDTPGSKLTGMGSARVATWGVFHYEGRTLTLLNVHFRHLSRREQARILLRRLSKLPRPWLVTGDFNSTPWPIWSAHRVLSTHLTDLAADAGSTWNGGLNLPLARLDWIFGSREIRGSGSQVLRQGKSDHWPVLVDVNMA